MISPTVSSLKLLRTIVLLYYLILMGRGVSDFCLIPPMSLNKRLSLSLSLLLSYFILECHVLPYTTCHVTDDVKVWCKESLYWFGS